MPAVAAIAEGVAGVVGIAQTLIESGEQKRANRELKRLFSQRKAYQTPSEIFEILNLNQFEAQQGFSDQTMSYLTGQAGSGLAAGLGSATRLGADPNAISGIIDGYYQDIFKIGAESDLVKMKKFDSLTDALRLVADNKSAEWASEDNLIKDQMQSAAQRVQAAGVGMQSGANLTLSALTALASNDLYRDKKPKGGRATVGVPAASSGGGSR